MPSLLPSPAALVRPAIGGLCAVLLLAGARPTAARPPGARAPGLIASSERGWPQWRGPRRDGICDEKGLLPKWPAAGPPMLWKAAELGKGYSSPIIAGGRLYITGDTGDSVTVFAFDLSGRPVWKRPNGKSWTGPFPGSRSSCAYAAGRLFHMNSHGRIAAWDAATGRELWAVDASERFGAQEITWGLSQSPIVDRGRVILAVGGAKALVVALDAVTGATVWTAPPLLLGPSTPPAHLRVDAPSGEPDPSSYASPILVEHSGIRMVVGCSLRHVFGVNADTGALLWTQPLPTKYQVIGVSPVHWNGSVLAVAPDTGGVLLRLRAVGGGIVADEVWRTTMDACHGGVVAVNGAFYGSWYRRPAWGSLDAATGTPRYQSTDNDQGSVIYADGLLYCLSQHGEMRLESPTAAGLMNRGRYRLVTERKDDVWAHPVIFGGRLYLRYHDTLWCYDIRAGRKATK